MLRISQELLFVTGEKLPDNDVDHIFKLTGMEEDLDGNIKYEGLRTKITFVYASDLQLSSISFCFSVTFLR